MVENLKGRSERTHDGEEAKSSAQPRELNTLIQDAHDPFVLKANMARNIPTSLLTGPVRLLRISCFAEAHHLPRITELAQSGAMTRTLLDTGKVPRVEPNAAVFESAPRGFDPRSKKKKTETQHCLPTISDPLDACGVNKMATFQDPSAVLRKGLVLAGFLSSGDFEEQVSHFEAICGCSPEAADAAWAKLTDFSDNLTMDHLLAALHFHHVNHETRIPSVVRAFENPTEARGLTAHIDNAICGLLESFCVSNQFCSIRLAIAFCFDQSIVVFLRICASASISPWGQALVLHGQSRVRR